MFKVFDINNLTTSNIQRWASKHQTSVKAWTAFAIAVPIIYFCLSDQDFSFLLTLSSLISCFCFLMVAYKISAHKSFRGVSRKMFETYVLIQLFRIISIVPFQGYLPSDRTGDWLYQLIEIISFCLSATIVYWGRTTYASSYNEKQDTFNLLFIVVPSIFLAILFHPHLNNFAPSDISWTFALYLEVFASLPQLLLFQREKQVEAFTSHFLAGQVLVKLLSFVFWLATYKELNESIKGQHSISGIWVLIGQGVQLIVLLDFIIIYIKCLSKGVSMDLYYHNTV